MICHILILYFQTHHFSCLLQPTTVLCLLPTRRNCLKAYLNKDDSYSYSYSNNNKHQRTKMVEKEIPSSFQFIYVHIIQKHFLYMYVCKHESCVSICQSVGFSFFVVCRYICMWQLTYIFLRSKSLPALWMFVY